ncbi:MAG: nucleotide exchange factor GrpE, partial [Myxococcales bacterium]|nr:nucleotide exchange factor GrpE [Myxococcales bacterium]
EEQARREEQAREVALAQAASDEATRALDAAAARLESTEGAPEAESIEAVRERLEREAGREIERQRRDVVLSFLDVVDDLERALDAMAPGPERDGVAMVRERFLTRLAEHGAKPIEALGEAFDPERHEAATVVAAPAGAHDGDVVQVLRTGYAMGDDVLRPALVAVARAA